MHRRAIEMSKSSKSATNQVCVPNSLRQECFLLSNSPERTFDEWFCLFLLQMTLDRTMERMTKARTMKVKYLNVYQFPHGQQYFVVFWSPNLLSIFDMWVFRAWCLISHFVPILCSCVPPTKLYSTTLGGCLRHIILQCCAFHKTLDWIYLWFLP